MVELGKLALDLVTGLLIDLIKDEVKLRDLPYFERRRIERRIEDSIAEVVEPLLPFLTQEKVSEEKQRLLIQTCVDELRPLTQDPKQFFQGSLDGQKIFDEYYSDRDLPQVIIEEDLKDIYTLLCPRIATLLCKIPAAVKDWENEAWSESYRRLDEITTQLRNLFSVVDELALSPARQADETLSIASRSIAQKVRFELDLTGLRADRPLAGKFDDFFVHPEIKEKVKAGGKQPGLIRTPDESFSEFLQGFHQAIIIAPAGAGKSTWTKWLQRETYTTRWTGICIRVELRRFSGESLPSFQELVREVVGRHLAEDLTAARISRWIIASQLVFILDGFDEIRPADRDRVYDWILELRLATRGCPIILTSRPLTTDHLNRFNIGWQRWAIEPFDESRIIEYIERWYAHTPLLADDNRSIDVVSLAKAWRDDSTIEPLTGNPLLLSTLLMVHHLDGSLPTGRSQLYRRYVDGMLGIWDDRRQVSATNVELSLEQKRQITRGFALKLLLSQQDQLDEPAVLEWLQEFLNKIYVALSAVDVLHVLQERSGLIVGPGIYSFAHKSIAEYLVAEAVLQGDQRDISGNRIDRFYLYENRNDDRWNIVTFLWAGLAPISDVEAFIEECIDIEYWALAYGILYDQYDRIQADIRRKLILIPVNRKQFGEELNKSIVYWSISHNSKIKYQLPRVPDFDLRGINQEGNYYSLISRAVLDGIILWSDNINSIIEWRDLLWLCVAETPTDIDNWKACLASPCPESALRNTWLMGAISNAFLYAGFIDKKNINLEILVSAYQEVCPDARGLLPIALISLLLDYIEVDDQQYNKFRNKVLEILPNSDMGEIVPEWLWGTKPWNYSTSPHTIVDDLLTSFVDKMEELVLDGHLERNATYELAINFVQELITRRNTLNFSAADFSPNKTLKAKLSRKTLTE